MSHAMQLEKLNGENYSTWVLQMKSCLITQDLWKPMITECPASGQERDRWLSDDEKALATITLCVRPSELLNIKDCKTSKDAWTALSELYNACGPARKVNLFKRLVRFKFHSSEKFAPQINEFCSIAENLREIAVTVPSDLLSILLLCSLPDDLESFVIAIESRDKLPTLDNLKSKILEEEQRRGDKYEPNSEKVLAMNSKNGERGNKKLQYSQQQQQRSRGADKQNSKVKCYECGRRGHIRAECRRRKDQPAPVALSVVNLQSKTDQKVWILDSGASSHMFPHKSFFNKLSKHSQKVCLATG